MLAGPLEAPGSTVHEVWDDRVCLRRQVSQETRQATLCDPRVAGGLQGVPTKHSRRRHRQAFKS